MVIYYPIDKYSIFYNNRQLHCHKLRPETSLPVSHFPTSVSEQIV